MNAFDINLKMMDKYRKAGEEREVVSLSLDSYYILLHHLKREYLHALSVMADANGELNYRLMAMGETKRLEKYIDMLENEIKFSDDKQVVVPFFENYERDLFLHLLESLGNIHCVVYGKNTCDCL